MTLEDAHDRRERDAQLNAEQRPNVAMTPTPNLTPDDCWEEVHYTPHLSDDDPRAWSSETLRWVCRLCGELKPKHRADCLIPAWVADRRRLEMLTEVVEMVAALRIALGPAGYFSRSLAYLVEAAEAALAARGGSDDRT